MQVRHPRLRYLDRLADPRGLVGFEIVHHHHLAWTQLQDRRRGNLALTSSRSCLQILFSILLERAAAARAAKIICSLFVVECERGRAFLDRHPTDGIEMFLVSHVSPPTVTLGNIQLLVAIGPV